MQNVRAPRGDAKSFRSVRSPPPVLLRFLGTGPAGGRPGRGRSRRRESSLHVSTPEGGILIDASRDFAEQAWRARRIDLVLLTHAHRDASGGLARLEARLAAEASAPVPVLAPADAVRRVRGRLKRRRHLRLLAAAPGSPHEWRGWSVSALVVPHAEDCTTFAWQLVHRGRRLVYASDLARLTPALRRFAAGAGALVVDGALWGRRMPSHLTIEDALPELATWRVDRILFTQIGRSTPDHAPLDRWIRSRCARAGAAYDGMLIRL